MTYVGGLVGQNTAGSTITASYAIGSADGGAGNGSDRVGGLVGTNTAGTITESYGFGMVTNEEIAGSAGSTRPTILRCSQT